MTSDSCCGVCFTTGNFTISTNSKCRCLNLPVIAVLNSALGVRFKSTVVVQAVPLYSKVLGVFAGARPPAPMAAFDVPVPVPLFSATGILTSVDQLVPLYLSEVDIRGGFHHQIHMLYFEFQLDNDLFY